jgi:hypothetical protein
MLSFFGKYQGYSSPIYDGTLRTSKYLTLSDGTRLAYDLIIPSQKGVAAEKPLPVLFKYTPYGRAWTIFDKNGKSTYVTEGDLHASHRKLAQAPYENMGLPYQTHNQSDLEVIPKDEPFEMVFSLLPTAYQFHGEDRMRITITFADSGNFDTPVLDPAPALYLLRENSHASFIEIPFLTCCRIKPEDS